MNRTSFTITVSTATVTPVTSSPVRPRSAVSDVSVETTSHKYRTPSHSVSPPPTPNRLSKDVSNSKTGVQIYASPHSHPSTPQPHDRNPPSHEEGSGCPCPQPYPASEPEPCLLESEPQRHQYPFDGEEPHYQPESANTDAGGEWQVAGWDGSAGVVGTGVANTWCPYVPTNMPGAVVIGSRHYATLSNWNGWPFVYRAADRLGLFTLASGVPLNPDAMVIASNAGGCDLAVILPPDAPLAKLTALTAQIKTELKEMALTDGVKSFLEATWNVRMDSAPTFLAQFTFSAVFLRLAVADDLLHLQRVQRMGRELHAMLSEGERRGIPNKVLKCAIMRNPKQFHSLLLAYQKSLLRVAPWTQFGCQRSYVTLDGQAIHLLGAFGSLPPEQVMETCHYLHQHFSPSKYSLTPYLQRFHGAHRGPVTDFWHGVNSLTVACLQSGTLDWKQVDGTLLNVGNA